MELLDIILCLLLLYGLVRGFFNGFLLELTGLLALIVGIYGALNYSGLFLNFLRSFLPWEDRILGIIAFALTFLIIVMVIGILGRLLTKMIGFLALGIINRLAGAAFGFLKMAFFASLFFLFLNQLGDNLIEEETKEKSILYGPVEQIAPLILPTLIEKFEEFDLFETPTEETEK